MSTLEARDDQLHVDNIVNFVPDRSFELCRRDISDAIKCGDQLFGGPDRWAYDIGAFERKDEKRACLAGAYYHYRGHHSPSQCLAKAATEVGRSVSWGTLRSTLCRWFKLEI